MAALRRAHLVLPMGTRVRSKDSAYCLDRRGRACWTGWAMLNARLFAVRKCTSGGAAEYASPKSHCEMFECWCLGRLDPCV